MNYRHLSYDSLLILTVALFLLGCSSQSLTTELLKTQPLEETLSPAPTSNITPSVAPLYTPTSTQSSISPTPTQPITSTIPNQTPTLTDSEREKYIMDLFKPNAECGLPCWWGIVPGETTSNETLQFLNEIGESAALIPQSDGTVVYDAGGFDLEKMKIYNHVSFYEKSGLIDAISIRSEGHNLEGFLQVWDPYKLKQIVQKYGKPSRIWINSSYSYGNSKRRGYDLLIFYDNYGILIAYSGIVKFDPIYHFCPWFDQVEDIQTIKMYLQSPENPLALERLTNYLINPEYTVPIENGGLTVDDLYSIFIEEEQPCFDFPGTLFP